MATISELIVAASVDPRGVRTGLNQALDYSKAFAREVEVVVGNTFKGGKGVGFEERGAQMVEGLLGGMQSELDRRKSDLREKLARGLISREQFTKEGQKAAQGFNEALLAGISHLDGRKLLSPGMREQMVAALREDGIKAGEAFSQGVQRGTQRGQARGVGYPGRGPGLQVGGRNAAPAVVAAAFGFESLARSEIAAEGGARAASRAVATFAAGFGTGGVVLTALIAGGLAMSEWWGARQKEIEETRKKFKEEIDGMVNDANASGIIQKMQEIEMGKRSGGASKLAPGSFVGGMNDLTAQNVRDRQAITEALRVGNMAEVGKLVDVVRERQKSIDLLKEQRDQLRELILHTPPAPRTAGGMLPAMKIEAPAVKSGMEAMTDEVTRLTTAYQQLKALGQDTSALYGEQSRAEREVTAALKAENDQTGEKANKLRALLVLMHQMTPDAAALANMPLPDLNTMAMNRPKLAPAVHIGAKSPGAFGDLHSQAERVKLLEREAAIMRSIGASGAAEYEEKANRAREAAIENIKALIEATDQLGPEEADRVRSGLLDVLNDLGVQGKEVHDTFQEIADAIRGAMDAADGFGLINEDLRRMVTGGLGLVGALEKAGKARAAAAASGKSLGIIGALGGIGGTIGVIGAGIQVISGIVGLFSGRSEELRKQLEANEQAIKENNDRLVDVRSALAGGTGGATGSLAAIRALKSKQEFDVTIGGEIDPKTGMREAEQTSHFSMTTIESIKKSLEEAGLTFDQFLKMVKDTGIELFDENGKLIAGATEQVIEYLQKSAELASKLLNTLDDQRLMKELHDRVFGKTGDADSIARELALLKQFAPDLAKQFEGLDATTKEGREQIEAALQALVAMIEAGTITPDLLGKFDNIRDLIEIILNVQGSLDGLGDAANSVTAALLNVPSGYKVAYQRYLATAPDDTSFPFDGTPKRKRFPFGAGAAGGSADMMGTFSAGGGYAGGSLTFTGDIYIDAQAESGEDIFAKVLKVAKRKAAVKFGDSTRWAEVQA